MPGEWLDYPEGNGRRGIRASIKVLHDAWSPRLGNHRDILVCLPPSYARSDRSYPVVYMHDGQNLFDENTAFAGIWGADRAVVELADQGCGVIVVGVPNIGPRRIDEYSPFADGYRGGGMAIDYLYFLTRRVKPAVDGAFRTLRDPGSTGILGSSLGGLVSLYALFRRPDVFGMAGAMSPAFWFGERAIFPWVGRQAFPGGRVWLDAGTSEGTFVVSDVTRMRDLLVEKGYVRGRDLECVLEQGGRHDEASWSRRLPAALRFMLEGVSVPPG